MKDKVSVEAGTISQTLRRSLTAMPIVHLYYHLPSTTEGNSDCKDMRLTADHCEVTLPESPVDLVDVTTVQIFKDHLQESKIFNSAQEEYGSGVMLVSVHV